MNGQTSEPATWIDAVHDAMHVASVCIGIVGVLVLVYGVAVGIWLFVRLEASRLRGEETRSGQWSLRKAIGFYILLALELLIAADLIETIMSPDLNSLMILGATVLIRIAISFSLSWELRGADSKGDPE